MGINKKNFFVIILLICVLLALGVYYFYHKKIFVKNDVLVNPVVLDTTKQAVDSNLVITSVGGPNIIEIEVKTDKDAVIKDIIDKKYDQAKTEIKSLLVKSPEDPELWYINSSLQGVLSDIAGAITSIDKALIYDAQNTTYWKWKISLTITKMVTAGISKTSSEYINTIKSIYENALKITNSNIEIITPYAIFLEGIGDINQAILYWEKAIVINPLVKQSYMTEIVRLKAKQ